MVSIRFFLDIVLGHGGKIFGITSATMGLAYLFSVRWLIVQLGEIIMDIGFECAASMPSVSREVEVGLRQKQRLLSGLPVSRLLDVGCNNGTISLLYARFCGAAEVYGVDVDHRLVSEAKKRGVKAFTCDLNLDKIPFKDNLF